MLKLGIFEIGTTDHRDDLNIIENTIELARWGEALGYSRFWLGEHHERGVAWRSPEILMAVLAGYTEHIKIGSAGILLPLNSPLRVAQNFKLLGSLFSDRIDLGIGRGTAGETISKKLLNGMDRQPLINDHIPRVKELLDYMRNIYSGLSDSEADVIVNVPINGRIPAIWMLGASGTTTALAIQERLNFALSLLHMPNDYQPNAKELFGNFLRQYENTNGEKPVANITVSLVCAKTKKERDEILAQHKNNFTINMIGDVDECHEKLLEISEGFGTDEIMLQLFSPDFKHKFAMFEKLAEKCGITSSMVK